MASLHSELSPDTAADTYVRQDNSLHASGPHVPARRAAAIAAAASTPGAREERDAAGELGARGKPSINELLLFCLWMAWIWAIGYGSLAGTGDFPGVFMHLDSPEPGVCHRERLGRRPWLGLAAWKPVLSPRNERMAPSPPALPSLTPSPGAVLWDGLTCLEMKGIGYPGHQLWFLWPPAHLLHRG